MALVIAQLYNYRLPNKSFYKFLYFSIFKLY
jgi:hypothetical protein